jgi:subtilisin family serine protease
VRRVEGTSFAAPFVSAAYAIALARGQSASELTGLLVRSAKDLGAPGRDPVYGWGLVQFTALPGC